MAMPIFSNRAPRVQYRDGLIFVELVTEGVDGTEITTTLALTRYTAISLGTGLVASERLENDNVYQFDKHIGEVQTH